MPQKDSKPRAELSFFYWVTKAHSGTQKRVKGARSKEKSINCKKIFGYSTKCLSLSPQTQQTGAIAQLVEQRTENPCVPSSILGGTTQSPWISFEIRGLFLFMPNVRMLLPSTMWRDRRGGAVSPQVPLCGAMPPHAPASEFVPSYCILLISSGLNYLKI